MIELYIADLSKEKYNIGLDLEKWTSFFSLPQKRQENDRWRSIIGRLIIYQYFESKEISLEQNSIGITAKGKPFVKGSNINFSISHSYNYVVVVFANNRVGVDIEKMEEINRYIAKRFFSETENRYIDEDDEISRFYDIWCSKEAYLKFTGDGLYKPLNSVSLSNNADGIKYMIDVNKENSFQNVIYILDIIDKYKLAICSECIETVCIKKWSIVGC